MVYIVLLTYILIGVGSFLGFFYKILFSVIFLLPALLFYLVFWWGMLFVLC